MPLKILHISPTFYPAIYYGGPIFSTYEICKGLAKYRETVELRVLTTDGASPKRDDRINWQNMPERYDDLFDVYFTRRQFGVSVAPMMLRQLGKLVDWADVVHLTGVYNFPTFPTLVACRTFNKPLIWSPRGSLMRWEKSRKLKLKVIWEHMASQVLLKERSILHLTTRQEAREAMVRIKKIPAGIITNGVSVPKQLPKLLKSDKEKFHVLYLSRLDPTKGLENLLQAFVKLPLNYHLKICGTGKKEYTQELKSLSDYLGLNDRVQFVGQVEGQEKELAFLESDVFVLPSYMENFGIAVAEALAHKLPVIVSNQIPWQQVEQIGCGFSVDNTPDSLAQSILRIKDMDLEAMGNRGRHWMQGEFSWETLSEKMLALYGWAIYGGEAPEFVVKNHNELDLVSNSPN